MTNETRQKVRARMEGLLGIRKRLYQGSNVDPNPQEQAVEMLALLGELTDDWNAEIAVETARLADATERLAGATERLDEATRALDRRTTGLDGRTRGLTWVTVALFVATFLLVAVHVWDLLKAGHG